VVAEAPPPQGDGVAVTAELAGDAAVGGPVGVGSAEDEAAAEGQRLRGRVGAGQGEQLLALVVGEGDGDSERQRHGILPRRAPASKGGRPLRMCEAMTAVQRNQKLVRDLRNDALVLLR
jgi:hypothetical protein